MVSCLDAGPFQIPCHVISASQKPSFEEPTISNTQAEAPKAKTLKSLRPQLQLSSTDTCFVEEWKKVASCVLAVGMKG